MTKTEVYQALKTYNELHHFRNDSEHWNNAFLLYNAAHGLDGKERLRMSCSKCFVMVREWLQR